jgi:hypothetical protein
MVEWMNGGSLVRLKRNVNAVAGGGLAVMVMVKMMEMMMMEMMMMKMDGDGWSRVQHKTEKRWNFLVARHPVDTHSNRHGRAT